MTIKKVAVYGAGSWGTALALQLARQQIGVLLWDIKPAHIKTIEAARENAQYLPHAHFPDTLHCSANLIELLDYAEHQLIVVPSHGFRQLLQNIKANIKPHHHIIWASKGLEVDSGKLLHQVLQEELPNFKNYAVISGPTFAGEVAQGLPTAMTVASQHASLAKQIAQAFMSNNFRVYTSDDVIGVELGGAIKNILAIAAGISDGLGFGANARAAIITRGLAEMIRLGKAMGSQAETMMGLAGVGDLVLTCTDDQSRNRRLGIALGEGKSCHTAMKEIGQAVEGVKSSQAINLLAQNIGVEMPICEHVHQILHQGLSAHHAVSSLLTPRVKSEF